MQPVQAPSSARRPRLLGWVILVLAVHLWLLDAAPPWLRPGPSAPQASVPTLLTRAVPVTVARAEPLATIPPATPVPSKPRPDPKTVVAKPTSTPPAKPVTAPKMVPVRASTSPADSTVRATEPAAPVAPAATMSMAANLPQAPAHGVPSTAHEAPVRVPESRRLHYDVSGQAKGFPYRARAELLWQHEGTGYNARLEIAAMLVGSRVQTSVGQITSDGLAPQRFSDKLRSEVAAHFERDKNKVSFSANTPDVPLSPGAQDRLSVLLQLSSLLAGEPRRYTPGSVIAMQTVGPRDADEWHFVVGPEEGLNLNDGKHTARKLSREPQREFDLRVDVWLAADLGYLPVQLKMTQPNGDVVQLQLKSSEPP